MNTGTSNQNQTTSGNGKGFEIIHFEKTKKSCSLCEDFASAKAAKDEMTAVMSCEGACLRGEVSRRVANKLCFEEYPEKTARVCLGGAFTKNTGQRNMVRSAARAIALEGCVIECASRMMKGVIPDLETEVIIVEKYYNFNKNLFALNDVSEDELKQYSIEATNNIKKIIMS